MLRRMIRSALGFQSAARRREIERKRQEEIEGVADDELARVSRASVFAALVDGDADELIALLKAFVVGGDTARELSRASWRLARLLGTKAFDALDHDLLANPKTREALLSGLAHRIETYRDLYGISGSFLRTLMCATSADLGLMIAIQEYEDGIRDQGTTPASAPFESSCSWTRGCVGIEDDQTRWSGTDVGKMANRVLDGATEERACSSDDPSGELADDRRSWWDDDVDDGGARPVPLDKLGPLYSFEPAALPGTRSDGTEELRLGRRLRLAAEMLHSALESCGLLDESRAVIEALDRSLSAPGDRQNLEALARVLIASNEKLHDRSMETGAPPSEYVCDLVSLAIDPMMRIRGLRPPFVFGAADWMLDPEIRGPSERLRFGAETREMFLAAHARMNGRHIGDAHTWIVFHGERIEAAMAVKDAKAIPAK